MSSFDCPNPDIEQEVDVVEGIVEGCRRKYFSGSESDSVEALTNWGNCIKLCKENVCDTEMEIGNILRFQDCIDPLNSILSQMPQGKNCGLTQECTTTDFGSLVVSLCDVENNGVVDSCPFDCTSSEVELGNGNCVSIAVLISPIIALILACVFGACILQVYRKKRKDFIRERASSLSYMEPYTGHGYESGYGDPYDGWNQQSFQSQDSMGGRPYGSGSSRGPHPRGPPPRGLHQGGPHPRGPPPRGMPPRSMPPNGRSGRYHGSGSSRGPPPGGRLHGSGVPQGPPLGGRLNGSGVPQGPPPGGRLNGSGVPQGPPPGGRLNGSGVPQGPPPGLQPGTETPPTTQTPSSNNNSGGDEGGSGGGNDLLSQIKAGKTLKKAEAKDEDNSRGGGSGSGSGGESLMDQIKKAKLKKSEGPADSDSSSPKKSTGGGGESMMDQILNAKLKKAKPVEEGEKKKKPPPSGGGLMGELQKRMKSVRGEASSTDDDE